MRSNREAGDGSHSSALPVALCHVAGPISISVHAVHHFPQIIEVKQKRKLSSLRCSFLIVRRGTGNPFGPASVYLKAHRSMLMRHMHMGIIMDIMVFCFILRFSSPQ